MQRCDVDQDSASLDRSLPIDNDSWSVNGLGISRQQTL